MFVILALLSIVENMNTADSICWKTDLLITPLCILRQLITSLIQLPSRTTCQLARYLFLLSSGVQMVLLLELVPNTLRFLARTYLYMVALLLFLFFRRQTVMPYGLMFWKSCAGTYIDRWYINGRTKWFAAWVIYLHIAIICRTVLLKMEAKCKYVYWERECKL